LRRVYPKQPIVGVGAVIVADGKILLEKRKNQPGRGQWSVPGGLVELGEKAEDTAIREVKEETNLEVEKPEHIDFADNIVLDKNRKVRYHFVIIDYLVRLKKGTLKAGSDAAELRWVDLEDVEKYDLTPTFRAFFQNNRKKLETINSHL